MFYRYFNVLEGERGREEEREGEEEGGGREGTGGWRLGGRGKVK
jgi:hypothetical protein